MFFLLYYNNLFPFIKIKEVIIKYISFNYFYEKKDKIKKNEFELVLSKKKTIINDFINNLLISFLERINKSRAKGKIIT